MISPTKDTFVGNCILQFKKKCRISDFIIVDTETKGPVRFCSMTLISAEVFNIIKAGDQGHSKV